MKIGGLLKFSLIDYPQKMSAVIFTQGCNFLCPYCHNPELVLPERFNDPIAEEVVLDVHHDVQVGRRGHSGAHEVIDQLDIGQRLREREGVVDVSVPVVDDIERSPVHFPRPVEYAELVPVGQQGIDEM